MKRRPPKIRGGLARQVQCPEHGAYLAGVLSIGEKEFLSRCPKCRADDAMLNLDRLKNDAFEILANLGRARMTNRRKRRDTDREFFVKLVDSQSEQRISVGKFWAATETEAVEMAKLEYPGLFSRLETHTWTAMAEPTGERSTFARSVLG